MYIQAHYGKIGDREMAGRLFDLAHDKPYFDLAKELIDDGWTEEALDEALANHPLAKLIPSQFHAMLKAAFKQVRGIAVQG